MEDIMVQIQSLLVVDVLLFSYFGLTIVDFVTGFLKALKTEGFRSRKIRDGVIRFIAELLALAFALIVDIVLGTNGIILLAVKSLFIFKQGISICENLAALGVDVSFIKGYLEEFKDSTSKK